MRLIKIFGIPLVDRKLDQGQPGKQIDDYFLSIYGGQVPASPTKRDFSPTAWVLPFAAILAGGGVIYPAMRKWVKEVKPELSVSATTISDEKEEGYQHRLDQYLRGFSERSFR